MPAKILIVTGDAAESLEVLYPYQRLREEGYEVHIAAPTRKTLRFVVHDFEPGYDTYTEKPGYTWPADLAFAEVDPGEYAALVIPGGRAPEYLRNDPELRKILKAFFDSDRPVARSATARCSRPRSTACGGAGSRPTPPWNRTCRQPARGSRTPRRSSTAPWSPPGPGRTTRLDARVPENPPHQGPGVAEASTPPGYAQSRLAAGSRAQLGGQSRLAAGSRA